MPTIQKKCLAIVATIAILAMAGDRSFALDFILADGKSWPGRLLIARDGRVEPLFARAGNVGQDVTPRVQSVTLLPSGRTFFCSGLDRFVFELAAGGERPLHHGGYLARQVRTDADGTLYWSGLETPLENNPLPDGFIYAWDEARHAPRTVLTFSQGDVGRDWWGAFDVAGGRVYIGTISGRTRIYDVTENPLRQVCELPISASAFRFGPDNALYACDGAGKLYRFADRQNTQQFEIILDVATPFADFALVESSR